MERIDYLIRQTVTARLEQLRDEIRTAIASKGLRASGRTQESLHVYQEGNEVGLAGRPFFSALEFGSSAWSGKTGIRCSYEEFKGIIYQWASDKGLNLGQASDFEKAVANIAWVIMRSGTKLYRNNGYIDVYDTLIDKALADMKDLVGVEVMKQVDVVIDQWARIR